MDYSKKMGALWEKQGKQGKFMSGYVVIDGIKHHIVVFSNNKRPDKQDPDWQIHPSEYPKSAEQKQEFIEETPPF